MSFGAFINKKIRECRKHLRLVERMLRKGGLEVKSHLDDQEPYLYVVSPNDKMTFGGIRVYKIGESVAYRIQKEEKTHPYGRAYRLDIKEMYDDLLAEEEMTDRRAARQVIGAVPKELKAFLEKSFDAERDMRDSEFDQAGDPLSRVVVNAGGTDYSNTLHSKTQW